MYWTHRPASEDDIEKVAQIEKISIIPPWSQEAFRAELGKKTSHFWVMTDDETDEIVSAYVVFSFPAEQAHIQTVAVAPKYRGSGIGKRLLRQVIAYVMRNGGESIVLEVRKGNSVAVQLYQSLGFMVIHTISKFYPDGEDAYSMIYRTERDKLTGDPDVDFDADEGIRNLGKQNLN